MNIYVGNLAYSLTEDELKNAFAEYGEVTSAKIIKDRETDRSKGFGFVEMSSEEDGEKAVEELNNQTLSGRNLKVSKAKNKNDRSSFNRRY